MGGGVRPRILEGAGWVSASTLPRGPNGFPLCRWCGKECPSKQRTFCSGKRATFDRATGAIKEPGTGCVHEHCLRSQPGYARRLVWARDQGKCAGCGAVCEDAGDAWQADHILPVVEGGGGCGLENLRTLCTACHKDETAALARRRAGARRAAEASHAIDGLLVVLPIRTRNPLNQPTGNTRVAGIMRSRMRAAHRKVTKITVAAHMKSRAVAPSEFLPARITITRVSMGELDKWDGLGAALKAVIDGVADVFELRDDDHSFEWVLRQKKGGRGVHCVEVLIEKRAPSMSVARRLDVQRGAESPEEGQR